MCNCTPTYYQALKCSFQSKACLHTLGVTHGLLSLQRVTCFSISSALENTLMSRCSCALSVHSSSWAGSVACQHHANVASVKAVDQIELNGISSWALRSHCTRLLNFSNLAFLPAVTKLNTLLLCLWLLFKAESVSFENVFLQYRQSQPGPQVRIFNK